MPNFGEPGPPFLLRVCGWAVRLDTAERIRFLGSIATLLADRSFELQMVTSIELSGARLLARLRIAAAGATSVFGVRISKRLERWVQQAELARQQVMQRQAPRPQLATVPSAPTRLPASGWYDDPRGGAARRWWDGTAWTEHAR